MRPPRMRPPRVRPPRRHPTRRRRRTPDRKLRRMSASHHDIAALTALLGRVPVADFDVVVRDRTGAPAVVRNAPLTRDGTPMPTRYWLVDRELSVAVARLESGG